MEKKTFPAVIALVVPAVIALVGLLLTAAMVADLWRPAGGGLVVGVSLAAYGTSLARARAR